MRGDEEYAPWVVVGGVVGFIVTGEFIRHLFVHHDGHSWDRALKISVPVDRWFAHTSDCWSCELFSLMAWWAYVLLFALFAACWYELYISTIGQPQPTVNNAAQEALEELRRKYRK